MLSATCLPTLCDIQCSLKMLQKPSVKASLQLIRTFVVKLKKRYDAFKNLNT